MKNLNSTEPIHLEKKYGWCADLYQGEKSNFNNDICTVWGSTEEELNHRVTMIKKSYEMLEALKEQLELEKSDSIYCHSMISRERHKKRYDKIESLLKEL